MEFSIPPYVRSQAVADVSKRLVERLRDHGRLIKSVYVLPAEFTNWSGWDISHNGFDEDDQGVLNRLLGQLAVSYVARELANLVAVNEIKYDPATGETRRQRKNFRLGLATGSTVYSLVEAFEFPQDVIFNKLKLIPLVLGPIPETLYSAGFITELFAKKMKCKSETISSIEPHDNTIEVSLSDKWVKLTQESRRPKKRDAKPGEAIANEFDWIITGIGAKGNGQLKAHVEHLYDGVDPDDLVGDICSRLFGSKGIELPNTLSDSFVGITFDAMAHMCSLRGHGKRVIAVAGGLKKYHAIRTLLLREGPDLVNILVTDELTARRLLTDIAPKRRSPPKATSQKG